MGFLSDFGAGFKALTGTPQVLEAIDRRQFSPYISLGSSPNARRASERISSAHVAVQNGSYGWIYCYTPSVRSVIDFVADNAAQLGVKVYKRISDDEREHVGDHPAAEALRWPNSWTPGPQFIRDLFQDFLIFDNAYCLKFPSEAGLTLVNIPPHLVGLVGRSYYQVEAYRIWDQDGGYVDFPAERILHWRGKNPQDPRRGESKLETAREELSTDAAIRASLTELARSGLSLPGWVERSMEAPEWSDQAQQRFIESFTAQAKTSSRRIPVLEDGMVFKQGGVTPEDAELILSRRYSQEQICALYGLLKVPPENEDQRRQFYADVLPPLLDRLASFLDLHILIREYGAEDHYVEFQIDEKLIGDDRLKALTSAAGAPPLTRNEARARLNLPAKEGGDELITPLNVTVGGKPSPQVMPIQNPVKPSQEGDHRDDGPEQASLVRNGTPRPLLPSASKQLLLPRRAQKERRRDEAANAFEEAIQGFLGHMERSLKSKQMDAKAVADERWEERLAGEIERVANRAVQREGEITAARLASGFEMALVANYLRTVSEAKGSQIVKAVRAALRENDPTDVFRAAREAETPRAAMSLATDMTTFATLEAARQDPEGERRMKTWIVSSSNSEHPEMDGESVPLGEQFSNGTDGPPADHPGCQCLLDIDGGGHPPVKHVEPETQQPIFVNIEQQAPPPVNVNVVPSDVNVLIAEGAVKSNVTMEAPPASPPTEVYVENPVLVEAAPAPNVTIDKGAVEVNVAPSDVFVEAPEAPNVNVEVTGGRTKRTVTFSDGQTAEIDETNDKRTVKFSDGRTAEISDSEEA